VGAEERGRRKKGRKGFWGRESLGWAVGGWRGELAMMDGGFDGYFEMLIIGGLGNSWGF
jgi:hypothetical protein